MMIRTRLLLLFSACMVAGLSSCVKNEVSFTARSQIESDGGIIRTGSLEIRISGERDAAGDSAALTRFYADNYIAPDLEIFEVSRAYDDSALIISWEGLIAPEKMPLSDYTHKSRGGSAAINSITVTQKNRWIFKDIIYREKFSDPVDTATFFPVIRSGLSNASEAVLNRDAFKGIREREEADKLLDKMETEAGLDIFRRILGSPQAFDTVSAIYDDNIAAIADSLAGFAGVKLNPDSLNSLVHDIYDAAWDTLLAEHPGIFGSFAFDDMDIHNFRIEVDVPGCLISSNADTTLNGMQAWSFNRLDFFAREYTMEITARNWRWLNIVLTFVVIAAILFIILGPVRKSGAGRV